MRAFLARFGYWIAAILVVVLLLSLVPWTSAWNWWNTSSFSAWSSDRTLGAARDDLKNGRQIANNNGRIKAIKDKQSDMIDASTVAGEKAESKTLTRQLSRDRVAAVRDEAAAKRNAAASARADAAEDALAACDDGDNKCIEKALNMLRPPFLVQQEVDELAAAQKATADAKAALEAAQKATKDAEAAKKAAEDALAKGRQKPAKVVRATSSLQAPLVVNNVYNSGPSTAMQAPAPANTAPAIAYVPPSVAAVQAPMASAPQKCTFSRHGVAVETFMVSPEEECKQETFRKNEDRKFSECVAKWGQDHCLKQRNIQAQQKTPW